MPAEVVLLLAAYTVVILVASLIGGWLPWMVRLTHRRMQVVISFIAGMMLGVGTFHLLGHARMVVSHQAGDLHAPVRGVMVWFLIGLMSMFLLERFFCYHHHDVAPTGASDTPVPVTPEVANQVRADDIAHDHQHDHRGGHDHAHGHRLEWAGALIGMTIHSIVAGIALAASVEAERHGRDSFALWGLGTFLVIALHKPFDSLTVIALMRVTDHPPPRCHIVNALFSLCIPIGVVLFMVGMRLEGEGSHAPLAAALAFSAGTFVCVALSDLLPELHFHDHDRIALSGALVLGLVLAYGIARMESTTHAHHHDHDHGHHDHDHGHHDHDHGHHDHDGHDHARREPGVVPPVLMSTLLPLGG